MFPKCLWLFVIVGACDAVVVPRTLHRDNCAVCHQPLNDDLAIDTIEHGGIEEAHPWAPLSCVDCHGGNARVCTGAISGTVDSPTCDGEWVYDKALAHVDPGDSPRDLKALTAGDLDMVDEAWVRFQNPSDLRVTNQTCGRCHVDANARLRRSGHALQTGDLAIARMRAGLQPDVVPRFGAASQRDPNPRIDECTTSSVTRFSPLLIDTTAEPTPRTAPTPANVQEQLLVQVCIGCHVQDSGPITRAPGMHRGAGCVSCHGDYAEDGLSRSADPFVLKGSASHPATHALVATPTTQACVACHAGGARIGLSYQGFREVAPSDDVTHAAFVGRPLYGLPIEALVRDEDVRNGFDETPADVHFEAGMMCVDCHGSAEVHGTGRIGGDHTCEQGGTRCEDCHGDVREEADLRFVRHALSRRDGQIVLTLRGSGRELVVPQARDSLDPRHAQVNGWSHGDAIECSTCHSSWMPSCYGCHVELDLAGTGRYLTTAAIVPGAVKTTLLHTRYDDQVLLWNQRGKLQGSMPAERIFTSLFVAQSNGSAPAFEWVARAFGQRPIDPHTTQRKSNFAACERCHSTPDGNNRELLDLSYGFGTTRIEVQGHQLDAVIARDGSPLVTIGHANVRPLSLEEIERMQSIVVDQSR